MGPKSGNIEKVLVFKPFLNGQRGDEYSREVLQSSGRSGFGVILGSHWRHFGVFGIILGVRGLLWSHFGPFSKYAHFSNGFKGFYTSLGAGWESLCSHFGLLWGHLLVHDGDFGSLWVNLGSVWNHF